MFVKFSEVLGVPINELIPTDRGVSASLVVEQRLSVLAPNERAWAEAVLGSRMKDD